MALARGRGAVVQYSPEQEPPLGGKKGERCSCQYTWYPSNEVVECFVSAHLLCISFQTQPLWWYFLSALPKCLLLSVLFLPYALYIERRSHVILISATTYVALYSLLPHKELRFIIYTVPLFNLVAAMALSNM